VKTQIRLYLSTDRDAVAALFRQFMAALTPPRLQAAFSTYVETAVREELSRIEDYYFGKPHQGFWVAERGRVIGMVGIEEHSATRAELRRMAVDAAHRRRGIGQQLLRAAESFCQECRYEEIILSTSEFQPAAMRLSEASGYRLVRTEIAVAQSHKSPGSGSTRYHYEKRLHA
jgi:GNAT superfamily N-acetyltransferase